ncbi:MAG: peptide chain release factor N(5)-glutamine methyltransferase [candidate division NC10 bacterium]
MTVEATVGGLLAAGAAALEGSGLPTARRDAEWLLAEALGLDPLRLVLGLDRRVPVEVAERFGERIGRRMAHEPLQYILGHEEWRGLRLKTAPAALIPRPETELLVEWAVELERAEGPWRLAADVGAGTGAIACALAAAAPRLEVVAVERSTGALVLAAANVEALGLGRRVRLVAGDLFDPLGGLQAAVDLVVSNPPYIATAMLSQLPREVRDWEPREALDGGPDGMAVHRRLIAESPRVLRRGGWLLMEMGERQAGPLRASMEASGFERIEVRRDLRGVERMIAGRER